MKYFILILILLIFSACQTIMIIQFDVKYQDSNGQIYEISLQNYQYTNKRLTGRGSDHKDHDIKNVHILSVQKYFIGIK